MSDTVSFSDFEKLDIRVGTIIKAVVFEGARKPAYQLHIDFGSEGIRKSSAQITKLYTPESLLNQQVIAVVNFPPRQIGNFFSECLVLGILGDDGDVTLLQPQQPVKNGQRIA